ncbi:DUF6881 domain-containing protein [Streptomyces sp. NPDC057654]|uniref:DUF6881 domain-containing protein n=1 Tax=Streptomyces sp. NPDC057654 TaxID=3346196 RepID=UPI0036C39DC8
MEYWKVLWHHDLAEEPVTFFSEIGADGYEVRKVQGYRDGRLLRADHWRESGTIGLSEVPVGLIEDVQAQAEFSATVIHKAEFVAVWERASWPV